jgi:ribonuclease R
MTIYQDPFAQREAQKYSKPIPSRELIMMILGQQDRPLNYEQLIEHFVLTEAEDLEALRRRLRAMQRDGQIMQNRRGSYGLVDRMNLVAGRIAAHKDGFGFLVPDQGTEDIFLSGKQMRSVFNGDRVLVALQGKDGKGRKEGNIVEILERNTEFLVGHYREEKGIGFVEASSKKIVQDILIPLDKKGAAKEGQIVNVRILMQPTANRQALGEVVEILGEYMAPGMEIDVALRSYALPCAWPEDVIEACKEYKESIPKAAYKDREDLRELNLMTIDGEDAKDFDDAVYCEPLKREAWRLVVAIADVSYYVQPESALDKVAHERGNSVYFPGRVIPMLPEILSNGLCSLKPNVDRLAMVCDMTISGKGEITEYRFYQAVICSKARMTYTNVAKILKQDLKLRKQYAPLVDSIENLYILYQILLKAREERGALDFESVETKIVFGRDKKINEIVPVTRNDAHRLIEEMMLAANVSTALYLSKAQMPIVYRVHPSPKVEKLVELREFLGALGLSLKGGAQPKPLDFAVLLKNIRERPDYSLIQTVLLRSMNQATYHPDNVGHFGLAYDEYTHFTSPIRRYPDLLVHRAINHLLAHKSVDNWSYNQSTMQQLGEHCSYTERRADEATRDVNDWLKCEFMMDKVGQSFEGIITSVKNFGVFVLLNSIYVEGMVHITALNSDYYDYDATHHVLRGQRTGMNYRLGDKISIKVARVDLEKRQIEFELAGTTSSGKPKKPAVKKITPKSKKVTKEKRVKVKKKKETKKQSNKVKKR